jgi:hypothetical protein
VLVGDALSGEILGSMLALVGLFFGAFAGWLGSLKSRTRPDSQQANYDDAMAGRLPWRAFPMATCPDCNGTGYRLIVNPINDPTDPCPRIYQIPVGCARCKLTGSVPDGTTVSPPIDPESLQREVRRTAIVMALLLFVGIVAVIVVTAVVGRSGS